MYSWNYVIKRVSSLLDYYVTLFEFLKHCEVGALLDSHLEKFNKDKTVEKQF